MRQQTWIRKGSVAITVVLATAAMFVADAALLAAVYWIQDRDFANMTAAQWQSYQTWNALLGGIVLGTFGSQLLLAVVFAAMGDGSSARRILYTTFGVAVLTNLLVLYSMWLYEAPWDESVWGFLMPLLFFYLVQIPFWGIRSCFGWIITSPWTEPRQRVRLRFTLSHLLGWSVFLAVPLCILQAFGGSAVGAELHVFVLWTVLLTALLMWLLYTLLSATMSAPRRIAAAIFGLLVALAIEVVAGWILEGSISVEPVIEIGVANISGGAITVVCLTLARWLGYRLLPFAARTQ